MKKMLVSRGKSQTFYVTAIALLALLSPAHALTMAGDVPACGLAANQLFAAAPTTDLCAGGLPTAPKRAHAAAPWTWECRASTTTGPVIPMIDMTAGGIKTAIIKTAPTIKTTAPTKSAPIAETGSSVRCQAIYVATPPKIAASGIPSPYAAAANKAKKRPLAGPIYLRTGDILDGVEVTSLSGPCVIILSGNKNITIKNSTIGPCRDLDKPADGIVSLNNTTNIRVERNVIHGVSRGAYFYMAQNPIIFNQNYVYDVQGPFPAGNMVQFHTVKGGTAPSKILCNVSDQIGSPKQAVEDHISLWLSKGLDTKPNEIAYNRIRGGTAQSGAGINPADGGGGNVRVHHNTIVNQGNVGTGIPSGENVIVEDNRVYADGQASLSGVGIGVRNNYPDQACRNNALRRNRVYSIDSAWYNPPRPNHYWTDGSCSSTELTSNIWGDRSLNAAIFNDEPAACAALPKK
jgi:hypothetical protein